LFAAEKEAVKCMICKKMPPQSSNVPAGSGLEFCSHFKSRYRKTHFIRIDQSSQSTECDCININQCSECSYEECVARAKGSGTSFVGGIDINLLRDHPSLGDFKKFIKDWKDDQLEVASGVMMEKSNKFFKGTLDLE